MEGVKGEGSHLVSRESKMGLLVASLNLSVHPLSVCRQ